MKNKKNIFIKLFRCRKHASAILTGIVLIMSISSLLMSCGTKKIYVPIDHKVTETVIMHDTVVRLELVPYRDTISTRPLPGKDTLSFLQNSYAYSYASFKEGMLNHSLGIKPGASAEVKIQIKEVFIVDSIPYPVEIKSDTITVYKLYWWQKYLLWSGVIANMLLLLYIGKKS